MTSRALALAFTVGSACAGLGPGLELEVAYAPAPATLAFETDEGHQVELSGARLRIEGLELEPCGASVAGLWVPAQASAHGLEALATSEGFELDVLHGGPLVRGPVLRPLPGHYCAARLHLGGEGAMALSLEGRIERHGRWEPVSVEAPLIRDVRLPFSAPLQLDGDLLVDGAYRGRLVVHVDQRRWLDALGGARDERLREALVTNVLGSITLEGPSEDGAPLP